MKKIIYLFLFLGISMTSCLEIVEDITINKDQSGRVEYRIEASQAGFLFNSLSSLFDIPIEDQIISEAEKLVVQLKSQPGISDINYNFNGRSGSYYLSFHFQDDKAFNRSVYALSGRKKTFLSPSYFRVKKNRFKKINYAPWVKQYMKKENIDLPDSYFTDQIYFTSIVHTPEKIIRSRPSNIFIDQAQQKTKQRFKLADIFSGKVNTGTKLKY